MDLLNYDPNNVFARILRGALPCKQVYEDDFVLAFEDLKPKARVHVLVIPKGNYISSFDFYHSAPDDMLVGFHRGLASVIQSLDLKNPGYRLITNHGPDSGQEVPHFHVHILSDLFEKTFP